MKTVDEILMDLLVKRPAVFGAIFRGNEPEPEGGETECSHESDSPSSPV